MHAVLVEPERLQRDALKELLGRRPELEIVAEASDGLEAVTLAEMLAPDLLILDMTLAILDGAEVTSRLRRAGNDVRIVILTADTAAGQVARALRAGADAYVTKRRFSELIAAIEVVRRGGRYLSEDLRARLGSADQAFDLESAESLHLHEDTAG